MLWAPVGWVQGSELGCLAPRPRGPDIPAAQADALRLVLLCRAHCPGSPPKSPGAPPPPLGLLRLQGGPSWATGQRRRPM